MPRMDSRPSIIERAFELAKSGQCHKIEEIKLQLHREHYSDIDLYIRGGALTAQLRHLLAMAQLARAPA